MNIEKQLNKLGYAVIDDLLQSFGYYSTFDEIRYYDNKAELVFTVKDYMIVIVIQDVDYIGYYSVDDIVYYIIELYTSLDEQYKSRLN